MAVKERINNLFEKIQQANKKELKKTMNILNKVDKESERLEKKELVFDTSILNIGDIYQAT